MGVFGSSQEQEQMERQWKQDRKQAGKRNENGKGDSKSEVSDRRDGPEKRSDGFNKWGQADEKKRTGQIDRNQGQSKIQSNTQTQTVDQNYANNIVYMALSTLESLEQHFTSKKTVKQFGAYDKVDYSFKELPELKAQMQMNLMLLANSLALFTEQYGKNKFQLPAGYDEKRVVNRLQRFLEFFKSVKDQDCIDMTMDFLDIMNGKFKGLRYESLKITDPYSKKGSKNGKIVQEAMQSSQHMHKEREDVEKMGPNVSAKDLKFKQNRGYQYEKR